MYILSFRAITKNFFKYSCYTERGDKNSIIQDAQLKPEKTEKGASGDK